MNLDHEYLDTIESVITNRAPIGQLRSWLASMVQLSYELHDGPLKDLDAELWLLLGEYDDGAIDLASLRRELAKLIEAFEPSWVQRRTVRTATGQQGPIVRMEPDVAERAAQSANVGHSSIPQELYTSTAPYALTRTIESRTPVPVTEVQLSSGQVIAELVGR